MKNNTPFLRQKGFSLLEILVAFSILALSLGVLLNIFSTGLRSAIISDEYIHAVTIAESLLSKAGIESTLEPGESHGIEEDKYSWNILIEPYVDEVIDLEKGGITPYRITVTVDWKEAQEERSIELNTLRLEKKSDA